MPTKTSSAGPPRRPPERATAWGFVLANLVLPGLGTWLARRRGAGIAQPACSQGGFIMALVGALLLLADWRRTGQAPEELSAAHGLALAGALIVFAAWFWALGSSFVILRRSGDRA